MLQKVVDERRPHLLAVAMDSRGTTFRHALDARYKATRPAAPAGPVAADGAGRADRPRVGHPRLPARRARGRRPHRRGRRPARSAEGWRVVIVSADKDLMQLVRDDDERVVLWDSMRDRVYGPPEVREKFGVAPSQVRDFLALTGDTCDNVPGVPGVGPEDGGRAARRSSARSTASTRTSTRSRSPSSARASRARGRRARLAEARDARRRRRPSSGDRDKLAMGRGRRGRAAPPLHRARVQPPARSARRARARRSRESAAAGAQLALGARQPAATIAPAWPPACTTASLDEPSLDAIARGRARGGQLGIAPAGDEHRRDARRARRARARDRARARALRAARAPLPRVPGAARVGAVRERPRAAPRRRARHRSRPRLKRDVDRPRARRACRSPGPSSTRMLAAYLLDPEAPNALEELARRELGVALARFDESRPQGARPAGALRRARRRARRDLRRARGRSCLWRCASASSRASTAEGLGRPDARRRAAARARARGDGDARRARRRADAREARQDGRGAAARARGRVQADRGTRLRHCARATSSRRSSSTS